MQAKSIFKKIPGFRSGSKLKALIASVFYSFAFLVILAIVTPTAPSLAIEDLPPTNQTTTVIKGTSSAGKPIYLLLNNVEVMQVRTTTQGEFAFNLSDLNEGEYSYTVEACNDESKRACNSTLVSLVIDFSPPLTPNLIDAPNETENPKYVIKGSVEPSAAVVITYRNNDYETRADDTGIFKHEITLEEGENIIKVAAQNWSEPQNFIIQYTKPPEVGLRATPEPPVSPVPLLLRATPSSSWTPLPTPRPSVIPTRTPTPTPVPKVSTPIPYVAPSSGSWQCDCTKTCPQMSTCAEAQYQLNTCGCSARDADDDGIACDADCQ